MRVLFATKRAHFPDRVDGAINSAHTLLEILESRGHKCEAVTGIESATRLRIHAYRALRLLSNRKQLAWPDRRNGYATYRAWKYLIPKLFTQRLKAFQPDIVVTQLEGSEEIAREAVLARIPTMLWIHDAEFKWSTGNLPSSALNIGAP